METPQKQGLLRRMKNGELRMKGGLRKEEEGGS